MEYNEPIPNKDYKVLVKCFTFNQSKYIEDALNGFTMQKTTFPFVCTIVDDCSTDGEQEIIKAYLDNEFLMSASEHFETEYANITIAQHKVNTNCTFAIYFLKYNHYSKKEPKAKYLKKWRECCEYEALCEGDDYWTHPQKLQMQVDFLDNHHDYMMCFHGADLLCDPNITPAIHCEDIENREYFVDEVFPRWVIPTASMVMRHEVLEYELVNRHKFVNGDTVMKMSSFALGRVWGFSAHMSVYRINYAGVNLNPDLAYNRLLRMSDHYDALEENYPFLSHRVISKLKANNYYLLALHAKSKEEIRINIKKSLQTDNSYRFPIFKFLIKKRMFLSLFSVLFWKN